MRHQVIMSTDVDLVTYIYLNVVYKTADYVCLIVLPTRTNYFN